VQRVDEAVFDKVFATVVQSPQRTPAPWLPRRLNALFRELIRNPTKSDPDEISDLIWAIWIDHSEQAAGIAMTAAIESMSHGAFDLASPILDRLVEDFPEWSEAWNKRATLAFTEKRDLDALLDIQRTLAIEPRHFGAMIGFGQICIRHHHLSEAKAAFETARAIHPHIAGLDAIIKDLSHSLERQH
jgi:tetratricopeptide (TPR) repeat protein